jgi:hypothetical protein
MADLGSLLGSAGIGGAIGKAIVSLELDTKKYVAEMDAAKAQTAAGTNTMASGFSKFGGLAQTALLGAGAAAVAFAAVSVKAAIEANDAHLKLQNTFENNARLADSSVAAFERQADALRDLTGVDDEAIISGQALLGQFKLTGSQVQQLTPLVVDLSAKMGIDLETAFKAVGKATQGNAGVLSRYGITLDASALKADAFGTTLKGLGVAQGLAADRAKAEPWRVLGAQFEEIEESVGQALIPLIQDLVGGLKIMLPVLEAATTHLDAFVVAAGGFAALKYLGATAGPIGATTAALVAFGLVLKTDTDALGVFTQDLADGTISVETFDAQTKRLADRLGTTQEQLLGTAQSIGEMRQKAGLAEEGILNLAGATALTKTHFKNLQETTVNFAHLTTKELKEWSADTVKSWDDVILSLEEGAHQTVITQKEFHHANVVMQREAEALDTAMRRISQENWVNDNYIKFLSEQGPEWLIRFSKETVEQQHVSQQAWKDSTNSLDAAAKSQERMIGLLNKLDKGETRHKVTIEYDYVGFDPTKPGMSAGQQGGATGGQR